MKITTETVDKLAKLAKLQYDEAGKKAIAQDLEQMIGFVEKLNELDLKDVEPLTHISENHNITRKDEIRPLITKTEALKNAPNKNEDFFKVPKVIKK